MGGRRVAKGGTIPVHEIIEKHIFGLKMHVPLNKDFLVLFLLLNLK